MPPLFLKLTYRQIQMKVFNDEPTPSIELLNHIKNLFPDKLPTNPIDIEDFRFLQGQQSVIQKLEELYKQNFEEE